MRAAYMRAMPMRSADVPQLLSGLFRSAFRAPRSVADLNGRSGLRNVLLHATRSTVIRFAQRQNKRTSGLPTR
jgi:hypothetical protein